MQKLSTICLLHKVVPFLKSRRSKKGANQVDCNFHQINAQNFVYIVIGFLGDFTLQKGR